MHVRLIRVEGCLCAREEVNDGGISLGCPIDPEPLPNPPISSAGRFAGWSGVCVCTDPGATDTLPSGRELLGKGLREVYEWPL